jgi:hypothetical protein
MVSVEIVRKLALAFNEVTEKPHFEKASFWVNKKIFATLDIKNKKAVIKLSPVDQSVFCSFDKSIIYPVPGKWGLHGWTMIELKLIKKAMLQDALTIAYCTVAPERLAKKYQQ